MEAALLAAMQIDESDLVALAERREQEIAEFFQAGHDLGPPRVTIVSDGERASDTPEVVFSLR